MTVPAVLVVLAVVVFPMAYSLFVSFTPFHLLRPDTTSQFVLDDMFNNYARLARDDVFWRALWNTILFMFVTVNVSVLIGFGLAMMLARMTFAMGPVRVLLMIPMMFAPGAHRLPVRLVLQRHRRPGQQRADHAGVDIASRLPGSWTSPAG